jgi:hypothetical protein
VKTTLSRVRSGRSCIPHQNQCRALYIVTGINVAVHAQTAGNNPYIAMLAIACMVPSRTSLRSRCLVRRREPADAAHAMEAGGYVGYARPRGGMKPEHGAYGQAGARPVRARPRHRRPRVLDLCPPHASRRRGAPRDSRRGAGDIATHEMPATPALPHVPRVQPEFPRDAVSQRAARPSGTVGAAASPRARCWSSPHRSQKPCARSRGALRAAGRGASRAPRGGAAGVSIRRTRTRASTQNARRA